MPTDDDYRRAHADGLGLVRASRRLGVSAYAVALAYARLGLPPQPCVGHGWPAAAMPARIASVTRKKAEVRRLVTAGYNLPPDLSILCVRVVLFLANGPATARAIAGHCGRKSYKTLQDADGLSLPLLIRRNLVVKTHRGGRLGPPLYALTAEAMALLVGSYDGRTETERGGEAVAGSAGDGRPVHPGG